MVKDYRPHDFHSLCYYTYTVLTYGCGLKPVFRSDPDDEAGGRTLDLSLSTLALGDLLSSDVCPGPFHVTLTVPGDRDESLERAREISRTAVVVAPRGDDETRVRSCEFA